MNMRRMIYAGAGLVLASGLAFAATVPSFQPGFALQDGSKLNLLVNQINTNTTAIAGLVGGAVGSPLVVGGTAPTVNAPLLTATATGTPPTISVGGASSDSNVGISLAGKGTGAVYIGGTPTTAGVQVAQTASAVNDIVITNKATGSAPTIVTGGTGVDTNVGMFIAGAGTGAVGIGGTTTTLAGLQVAQTASRVNDLVVTPGATGTAVDLGSSSAGADTNVGITLTPKGTGIVKFGGTQATCTGTTTATCSGQRFVVSITGLTTAASTLSAAMVVTNTSVASSSSIVQCQVQNYAGTGVPLAAIVTSGTSSLSVKIQNVSTAAALNATVPVSCVVFD